MPPRTTPATDLPMPTDANSLMLGELRGQMREVIHGQNNMLQKFDSLTREVVGLGPLASDVLEIKTSLTALSLRVAALETEKSRTDGAKGLGVMLLKSPALGWLVGAAISAWAVLTGKVHV